MLSDPAIFSPLSPASLKHKNPQRYKIIHGMHPIGHKDWSSDMKMFL